MADKWPIFVKRLGDMGRLQSWNSNRPIGDYLITSGL